jgi:hypothetical protein
MRLSNAAAAGLAAAVLAVPARAGKAHEHGVAQLDIGVEPARVSLMLDTPLDNVLGYERAPRTEAERAAADAVLARLRAGTGLFSIDSQAACGVPKVEIKAPALEPGAASKDGHADLEAIWDLPCKSGAKAGFVDLGGLFDALPRLKRVNIQIATPRGHVKASLTRGSTRIRLVR